MNARHQKTDTQERGWAMFRLIDGKMCRVSQVGDQAFALAMLDFDEFMLSYMRSEGLEPDEFYIRPVDLEPGTP